MDENSQNPTPPAPAPSAPAPEQAPVTPPAPAPAPEPTPAPKTIDPVDHSKPAEPAPAPTEPVTPPAPEEGQQPQGGENEPDELGEIFGDATPDEMAEAIQSKQEAGEELPGGINPDGTVNPLVYAYENMPEIKVMGREGNKGEIKEFVVKTADDLPDNFKFANAKAMAEFNSALAQNTQIAKELIEDAKKYNDERTAQNERRTILVNQKTEIDKLIADGKLPEMKLKHTDPNFMQDPGAQRAKQVLDHMATMNKEFKEAGINQTVTSVALALRDLEAREAIESRDNRMGTITQTRNNISSKINSGNNTSAPAQTPNGQRVHKDVNSALRFARKQHGI